MSDLLTSDVLPAPEGALAPPQGMSDAGADDGADPAPPDGPIEERAEDGTLTLSATMVGGVVEGTVRIYDAAGQLQQVAEYRGGVPDGESVIYEKGRPQARMTLRDGVQHGPAATYGAQGELTSRTAWAAGKLDGLQTYFGPGERVVKTEEYRAGALHGWVVEYHLSGAVRQRTPWVEDKLHGEQLTYDEGGKVVQRLRFHEGVPVADAVKGGPGARRQAPPRTLLDRLVLRVKGKSA